MLMRMLLLCVVDRYGGLDGAGGDRKDLGVRLYYIDGVGFVCYLDACIRKVLTPPSDFTGWQVTTWGTPPR